MKKILLGLVIALMMTGSGYAKKIPDGEGNIKVLEAREKKDTDYFNIRTFCIHGYLFVAFDGNPTLGSTSRFSTNQVFANQVGRSLPKQC